MFNALTILKVSLSTFGTFVATSDESLTAERAFVALSLFNILKFPIAVFPRLISGIVQASVSLKRLTAFLKNDELDPDNVHNIEETTVGMVTVYDDVTNVLL